MNKIVFSEAFQNQKEAILDVIENFHLQPGENVGTGDRNTIMAYTLGELHVNVKSFKVPNLINKIVYRFFRPSKARRSFENAQKLLSFGIGTPTPIAFMENYNGPFFEKSYYVSEQQTCDFTFRTLIHEPDTPRREEIIRKFTRFTFDLHEHGVLFKDHSPGNTLIQLEGEKVHFYLVDLNRMQFKTLTLEERIENFERLTPLKDMVEIMSEEYAMLMGMPKQEIFEKMWHRTEAFQYKFHRKRRLKKKFLFWRR